MAKEEGRVFLGPNDTIEINGKKVKVSDIKDPKIKAVLTAKVREGKSEKVKYVDEQGKTHTLIVEDRKVKTTEYLDVDKVSGDEAKLMASQRIIPTSIAERFKNGPVVSGNTVLKGDHAIEAEIEEELLVAIRRNTEGVERYFREQSKEEVVVAVLLKILPVPVVLGALLGMFKQCTKKDPSPIIHEEPDSAYYAELDPSSGEPTIIREVEFDVDSMEGFVQHFHGVISAHAQEAGTADALKGQALFDTSGKYSYLKQEELEAQSKILNDQLGPKIKEIRQLMSDYLFAKEQLKYAENEEYIKQMEDIKQKVMELKGSVMEIANNSLSVVDDLVDEYIEEATTGDFADEVSGKIDSEQEGINGEQKLTGEAEIVDGHSKIMKKKVSEFSKDIDDFFEMLEKEGSYGKEENGKIIIGVPQENVKASKQTRRITITEKPFEDIYEQDSVE